MGWGGGGGRIIHTEGGAHTRRHTQGGLWPPQESCYLPAPPCKQVRIADLQSSEQQTKQRLEELHVALEAVRITSDEGRAQIVQDLQALSETLTAHDARIGAAEGALTQNRTHCQQVSQEAMDWVRDLQTRCVPRDELENRLQTVDVRVVAMEESVEGAQDQCQHALNMHRELKEWVHDMQNRCVKHSELEDRCSQLNVNLSQLRHDIYQAETALAQKLRLAVEATGQEIQHLQMQLRVPSARVSFTG